MKADYYANRIIESDNPGEEVVLVVRDIVLEAQDLIKQRKATTNEAAIAINNELERKWKAVCRRVNARLGHVLSEGGYLAFMKSQLPELFAIFYENGS